VERAEALQKLLIWCLTDAQKYNDTLLYAPLPKAAQKRAMNLVLSMQYDDKKLKEEVVK
jgi:phosphate transport system substrate-binding protein